jgi:cytoskeletal protein RodZ
VKDIGSKFKEARETIGLSIEETCNDMQVTDAQLENLEDGNANAFKDIFFLKELVKKYAKYLNLDVDDIMEEFNDFIFNFTSKIPVKEIEEKVKEISKEEKSISTKKIYSPYTAGKTNKKSFSPIILYIIAVILVTVLILLSIAFFTSRM